MTKKLIRITALILVLVLVLVPNVSAVADDNPYINGMAQGSVNGTGNYFYSVTAADKVGSYYTVYYDLYREMSLTYVDIVIRAQGAIPSALRVNSSTLTRVSIGNSLYRYFGSIGGNTASNRLKFEFTAAGSFTFSILNFNMAVSKVDHFASAGVLLVDGVQKETWTASANGNGVSLPADDWSQVEGSKDFQVKITDWKGADYAELLISAKNISFGSISAYMDATIIPIQVDSVYTSEDIVQFTESHLGGSSSGSSSEDGSYFPGDYYDEFQSVTEWSEIVDLDGNSFSSSAPADRVFRVRLDLRAVDRTMSSVPLVRFTAKYSGYYGYTFKCSQITCFVDVDGLDDSWLSSIQGFFSDLKSNLVFHLSVFQSSIEQKFDELIGDGSEGDDLSSGSQELSDDIDQIDQFEQSQMHVMDTGMVEIQDAVSVASFTGALSFVQNYLNLTLMGLGDVMVIFTLPLFLGLFFYICSRVPGATRWKSPPPKGGKK